MVKIQLWKNSGILEDVKTNVIHRGGDVADVGRGDFNIRIGQEGGLVDSVKEEEKSGFRASKDRAIGNPGRKMIDFLNKKG